MILTTKEFIKEVEKLELYVDKSEKFGLILVTDYNHGLVAYVKNDERCQFSTAFNSFDNLLEPIQRKLIELIGMYARTLPDKREEPERFFLKFKIEIDDDCRYLNYYKEEDELTLDNSLETSSFQTLFTDKELEKLKEKFEVTLSDFEKIPIVENEEKEEC